MRAFLHRVKNPQTAGRPEADLLQAGPRLVTTWHVIKVQFVRKLQWCSKQRKWLDAFSHLTVCVGKRAEEVCPYVHVFRNGGPAVRQALFEAGVQSQDKALLSRD